MKNKIHKWLTKRIPPYRWFIALLKRITLPGFQGLRLYTVLLFFLNEFSSKEINNRASAIAFNFFLALFPATIFFFTLIAYIPIQNFQDEIFRFMQGITPRDAFEVIQHTLADILKNRQGGLLSLGFFMAMYFSTTGINSLIDAFNTYTHSVETRSFWRQQLTALWLTFYVALLIIISIALTIIGDLVLGFLNFSGSVEFYMLWFVKWFLTLLFIYCLISGLFFYGPAKKRRWPFFSAGSTLATILSVITTYGFVYYVNNFNSYNRLYGSIGTLIVIMLLIFINFMVILIGFELNVSIDRALKHRLTTEQLTPKNLETTLKEEKGK